VCSSDLIGTIQNLEEIGKICKSHNIVFHTDATQSFLKTDFDVNRFNISMASFSGHKFHAPKGIGFVYKKHDVKVQPIIDGGGQEFDIRGGTQNMSGIVGISKAASLWSEDTNQKIKKLQEHCFKLLCNSDIDFKLNGPSIGEHRLNNNLNISIKNQDGETLLHRLSDLGFCVSTASACASNHKSRVSAVIQSINCPLEYAYGTIRVSFSSLNNFEEIELFINSLKKITIDLA